MYVCAYVHMYVCMNVYMYVRMYVCMHVCMYVCIYVCMYVCVYTCSKYLLADATVSFCTHINSVSLSVRYASLEGARRGGGFLDHFPHINAYSISLLALDSTLHLILHISYSKTHSPPLSHSRHRT